MMKDLGLSHRELDRKSSFEHSEYLLGCTPVLKLVLVYLSPTLVGELGLSAFPDLEPQIPATHSHPLPALDPNSSLTSSQSSPNYSLEILARITASYQGKVGIAQLN